MSTPANQRDLEIISNAILDGDTTFDALPENVQSGVLQYMSGPGAAAGDVPTQEKLDELARKRQETMAEANPFNSPIFKPIEWVGSKLYALYSSTVSPAISAGAMAVHNIAYGRPEGAPDASFGKSEWDYLGDIWDQAHNVSPGQAVWMLGLNNEELKARGITPGQMSADKKLVAEGKAPMGKTTSEKYFGSGLSQFSSGLGDFAVSWWADPLVLAGKGVGAARQATFVRPVTEQVKIAGKIGKKAGLAPEQSFELMTRGPVFQNMVDQVAKIKAANPDNAALVLRRDFQTIARSKDGDTLSRLLMQARDKGEISDILRVSMGDKIAIDTLIAGNIDIGYQIAQTQKRVTAHGTYFSSLTPAQQAGPRGLRIKAAIDAEKKFIEQMNRNTKFIDDVVDGQRTIDNMNFNSITTQMGLAVRGSKTVREGGKLKNPFVANPIKAAGALVYNASVGVPVKLIRSYNDIRPTAYVDIHAEDSYRNVAALLEEAPTLDRATRERMVSQYLKVDVADRGLQLVKMETEAVASMIARYNVGKAPADQLSHELGMELYRDFATRRRQGQIATSGGRSYGSGTIPDPAGGSTPINVAEIEADGGRLITTPIFETQLANSHVMLDFKAFDRMLKEHGSAFQKSFGNARNAAEWTVGMADTLGSYWKFAQLFRLGYAPRALADDFLGQLARFGPAAMAGRMAEGGKVTVQDFFRGRWASDDIEAARFAHENEVGNIERLTEQQQTTQRLHDDPTATPADKLALKADLDDIKLDLDAAHTRRKMYSDMTAYGAQTRDIRVGRQPFEGALAGKQGQLFADLSRGEKNLDNMLGSEASSLLKRSRRMDWKNIRARETGHMEAWTRKINRQIAHSKIGRRVLMGDDEAKLVHWMRNNPEGRAYRAEIGLKNMPDHELAQRVKAEVDHTLNPAMPGMDAIRVAALNGTLESKMLEAIPMKARPDVNAQSWSYATGENPISKTLDTFITGYFKLANQLPAEKMLRHPLFGQQYKADLAAQMRLMRAQGITHVDETTRLKMQETARKAALRDVKSFTFTMDHETKMAYSMRHFGAFFGAQQESWNRWARIISDKPQTLAHVAQVYGAPTRSGITVDQDGNTIDGAGFSTDPATGEKKLTKYSERKMLIQIPDYLGGEALKKDLGLDPDAVLTMPLSSAELVLNNGDGVFPVGAGPMLQIGVNHFAQESPDLADWSKKLGVLPFGPQDSWTDFVNPNTGKRLGDSMDDFSESRQRNMFYMMQVENYKYQNGMRETPPSWKELKDRADRWSIARTAFAFVLPLSVNQQDPYQFFRDEFQRYQKLDPDTADQKFYDKYGDSFYTFTQSMSKNNTGLRPTAESVAMSKYYQDLVDKVGPEYAGLIVGHEGEGKFSEGAYFYQKTHSAGASSDLTQRENMSASEAWSEAQKALGWKQYNSAMNGLRAELFDAGFKTFGDPGAEQLKAQRDAIVGVLGSPITARGEDNAFYNKAWSEAYNSVDRTRYDRRAADIWKIVNDPELWAKAQPLQDGTVGVRSDIFTLHGYLEYRRNFQVALIARKSEGGSSDPLAQSNSDLKEQWDQMVMDLLEKDTKFEWIHNRWFSGDMGFDKDSVEADE